MFIRNLLLVFLSIKLSSVSLASTFYVKTGGNDASDGLSTITAWQSIAKVNATTFVAGDIVLFEGGSSFSGNIYFSAASYGTIKKPIIISSYGSGKATINAGNGNGFFAYNNSGIEVKNLIFSGSGITTNSGIGVYFFMDKTSNTKLKYILMENLEVKGFKTSGIQISSWPTDFSRSGYDTIIVRNCIAHENGLSGISVSGYYSTTDTLYSHKHLLVSKCKAYNNYGQTGYSTNSGNGIIIGQVDSAVMEYCEAYENGKNNNFAGGGPAGIWAWDSKNVNIQYCYSHHNRSQTLDGDGFDLDGGVRNSIMQYNYSHDNDGPGFLVAQYTGARKMKNIAVRYNISERDGKGLGALIWSGDPSGTITAEKIDFYNNTIYIDTIGGGFANAAIAVYSNYGAVRDIRICNNIFITKNNAPLIDVYKTLNLKFYNNVYFDNGNGFKFLDNGSTFSSLNIWRSVTGQEVLNGKLTGIRVDPLLINAGGGRNIVSVDSLVTLMAYRLKSNSPIIGKGVVIDSLYGFKNLLTDFYNDTIIFNNQYTPGAHEIDAPKAQFSVGNSCRGNLTKFINRSLKSNTYYWQFGDGSTSYAFSPNHLYKNAGSYLVTLTVSGKFGYVDSIKKTVDIFETPSAIFTISGNNCQNNLIAFKSADISGVNYSWLFDDSTSSNGPQSIHRFKYAGSHQIKLVSALSYCKDSLIKQIDIFINPITSFTTNNHCQGNSKLFSSNGSGDSYYHWNFGDGSFSNTENTSHIYHTAGFFSVQLIVGSSHQCFDTFSQSVEIYNKPKSLFKSRNHCFGEQLPLENLSVDDSLCLWDFGDGITSALIKPTITLNKSGNFIISLTTISIHQCYDTLELPVEVYSLPSAQFSYTRKKDSFYFKAKDTSLFNYQWMNNNSLLGSNKFQTTIQFPMPGLQKITLKTFSNNVCSDSSFQILDYIPSAKIDLLSTSEINIFPNPYSDALVVENGSLTEQIVSIKIADLQGREIYNFAIPEAPSGKSFFIIDNTNYPLASGVYHLILTTNINSIIRKIIKN